MFLDFFFIHVSNNNWFIIVFNYLIETLFHDHIKRVFEWEVACAFLSKKHVFIAFRGVVCA
jgi:hypothetical protein